MTPPFGTSVSASAGDVSRLHQERVNGEMFKAIELLGRKLERAEEDRLRLTRRLALIESSAAVDEKTGKLYLPVVVDPAQLPQVTAASSAAPKWAIGMSMMSSALALFAVGLVLLRAPVPPSLTAEQMAALEALTSSPQFAKAERPWSRVEHKEIPAEEPLEDIAGLPDVRALAQEEQLAEKLEEKMPTVPQTAMDILAAAETAPVVEPAAGEPAAAADTVDVMAAHIPGEDAPVERAPEKILEKTAEKPAAEKLPEKEIAEVLAVAPRTEEKTKPAKTSVKQAEKPAEKPVSASAPKVAEKPAEKAVSSEGISADPKLPAQLADLEKRAFQGVPEAQHDLATLYAAGKLVGQDYKRAVYWFSKAADGGVANADYNLGVMFQQGLGVKADMKKSLGWYTQAATLGHPEAMYNLGIAYIEGIGVQKDTDRGISYFKQAANAGVAQAAFNLGVLYESGFMGPVDADKAIGWYQVAANEGHKEAGDAVTRLRAASEASAAEGLTMADKVEPAAGEETIEEAGEGDASPVEEDAPVKSLPVPGTAKRKLVADIQKFLSGKGYLPPGKDSGVMDPQTEDAIRAWQSNNDLAVDGAPSDELLGRMRGE